MENLTGQSSIVLPCNLPPFDALRGLAILAVFIAHSEFILALPNGNVLQYARIGVGLFFVLAGRLINGIPLDSKGSLNYFRNFVCAGPSRNGHSTAASWRLLRSACR
jgi:peptidoglycan/LPS O-acetylase OafA/YrhL